MLKGLTVLCVGVLVLGCDSRSPKAIDDPDGRTSGSGGTGGTSATGGSGGFGGTSSGGSSGEAGSGGASGDVTGAGGSAGAGPIDTTPTPCNASDGSGCEEDEICLDLLTDACAAGFDEDCPGLCAAMLPASSCDDGSLACGGTVTCKSAQPECPDGLVNSIVDSCWGPCVPADCCTCSDEVSCPNGDAACDRATGRCRVAAAPEPRCALPFEPVDCQGAAHFSFIDGRCQQGTDGACGGNDNSFDTLEECLRRCEGLPQQADCPGGRVASSICLACGFGGGCMQWSTVCAKSCDDSDDCDAGMSCVDGVCGANFCI